MDFNFKDTKSKEIFQNDVVSKEEDSLFLQTISNDTEIEVSSKFSLNALESLNKNKPKIAKQIIKEESVTQEPEKMERFSYAQQLHRIETKQNLILDFLENQQQVPLKEELYFKENDKDDLVVMALNLEVFSKRLIIFSKNVSHQYMKNALLSLQEVSEHLLGNSFYIFSKENSPVKLALEHLKKIGMGNYHFNVHLDESIKILENIDRFSKMRVFEQSYNFSNLLLQKGLTLNAITLLNEATSIYMIESMKKFSKEISEYIFLIGEENKPKLYSRAKEYFTALFAEKPNVITLFPHHITVKPMDKEIARKLQNIHTTWSHKGDEFLFKKYIYIINRIKYLRNSLAHGNMEISFRDINHELKNLNDDFAYLAIKKNIFLLK